MVDNKYVMRNKNYIKANLPKAHTTPKNIKRDDHEYWHYKNN